MGSKKQPLAANLREIPHTKKHRQTNSGNLPLIQCLGWQVDKTPSFPSEEQWGFIRPKPCLAKMGLTSSFENIASYLTDYPEIHGWIRKKTKCLGIFRWENNSISKNRAIWRYHAIYVFFQDFFWLTFPAEILEKVNDWIQTFSHGLWNHNHTVDGSKIRLTSGYGSLSHYL